MRKLVLFTLGAFVTGSLLTYVLMAQNVAFGQAVLPAQASQKIKKVETRVDVVTDVDEDGNEVIVSETPVYKYELVVPTTVEDSSEWSIQGIDDEILGLDSRKAYLLKIRAKLVTLEATSGESEVIFDPTK